MKLPQVLIVYSKGRPDFLVIDRIKVDRFKLLSLAENSEDEDFAWQVMNLASVLFHWQDDEAFNDQYEKVAMEITRKNLKDEEAV